MIFPIINLRFRKTEGRPLTSYSSLVSNSLALSQGLMSFYQKRKPQETFRHHKSLMTQKQNYELYENQPQGLLLLEEALEIFGGGQHVPRGQEASCATCLNSPLGADAPSSCRAGRLSHLGSVSSEPHLPGRPLLHRCGWASGHRNAFESGSPHFP